MILTDESLMPFGKFKGIRMEDVPGSYLLWLYDEWTLPNPRFGFVNTDVKEYIEDNMDAIKMEVKNEKTT